MKAHGRLTDVNPRPTKTSLPNEAHKTAPGGPFTVGARIPTSTRQRARRG